MRGIKGAIALVIFAWHKTGMKHAETVTFGGSGFDRAAHLRETSATVLCETSARFTLIWRGKPLIDTRDHSLVYLDAGHPMVAEHRETALFLGLHEKSPLFAIDISHWQDPNLDVDQMKAFLDQSQNHHPDFPEHQLFCELRGTMSLLTPRDAELAATKRGLFAWQQGHKYCPRCGGENTFTAGGWRADCSDCKHPQFPRTDPVVIMLITHGNDTLLGRAPNWPEGMYSCLAGFMEPGETIEAAVRRETLEETNVNVGDVSYLASQPWAFPSSLMIGCHGQATSRDITIDPLEIETAKWVSRETVLSAYAGKDVGLKPARKGAIAAFLIENWLKDTLE
ncbi:NAD(+) diphosphatase [Paramylibacter kogurei]